MLILSVFSLDSATVVLFAALTIILLAYFNTGSKSHGTLNSPPGPAPLPVIGNLHMLDLKKLSESLMKLYNAFPFLGFLPGSHKKFFSNSKENIAYLKTLFNNHYQNLDENDLRSFIDAFMLRQQRELDNPNSYFNENKLMFTTVNLFAAGMETTLTTNRWGMLLMMKYPEIQKRVHEEIIRVIGSDQSPRTQDRKSLPYTDAVIHEIQRFSDIVPLSILRETTVDTTFKGFFIPKGTHVIPLLSSVLCDKTQWEKPNDFNPSHFLDVEGKFVKRDAFMPFSAGSTTYDFFGLCIGGNILSLC